MNEIEENLQQVLVTTAAQIIAGDPQDILWEADIDEYGFGSMEVNQLCVELNEKLGISIQPVLFLETTSLEGLSRHLIERYPAQIERHCL